MDMTDYGVVKTWRIPARSIEDAFKVVEDTPPDQQETHVLPEVAAADLQEYVVRRGWRVSAGSPAEAVTESEKRPHDRTYCVAPDDDHDPGVDGLLAEL